MANIDAFVSANYREIPELDDDMLISYYNKAPSVIKRMEIVNKVLADAGLNKTERCNASKSLMSLIIPSGTKSTIRGRLFNDIISKEIKKHIRNKRGFGFKMESRHTMFHEIPDWIIQRNGKTLVGFNQISLFGGGHQLNRASKYILDTNFHKRLTKMNIKMVCVVKDLPIETNGKAMTILKEGIRKKTIYCVGGIKQMIKDYFM